MVTRLIAFSYFTSAAVNSYRVTRSLGLLNILFYSHIYAKLFITYRFQYVYIYIQYIYIVFHFLFITCSNFDIFKILMRLNHTVELNYIKLRCANFLYFYTLLKLNHTVELDYIKVCMMCT